jgi:ribosome-associated protein
MALIEDTRQQVGQHTLKHSQWQAAGEDIIRCRLPFGDYARPACVVVDTKRSIDELAQNIGSDHQRFKRECIAARDAGSHLYILVENDLGISAVEDLCRWENPRAFDNRVKGLKQPIDGKRLARACLTMTERYGVEFFFCAPDATARMVIELLDGNDVEK